MAGVDIQVLQVLESNEQTWIDFTEAAILGGEKGRCSTYKNVEYWCATSTGRT